MVARPCGGVAVITTYVPRVGVEGNVLNKTCSGNDVINLQKGCTVD